MDEQLIAFGLVIVGALVGGFLARRITFDKPRAICAGMAAFASILSAASAAPTNRVMMVVWLGLAVIMLSALVISRLRRMRPAA